MSESLIYRTAPNDAGAYDAGEPEPDDEYPDRAALAQHLETIRAAIAGGRLHEAETRIALLSYGRRQAA